MIPPSTRKRPWNKGRKLPAEVLTPEEVKALMDACSKRASTGIRNKALIAVLYRGLLRIDEALSLKPKDLDPKRGTLAVLHGKNDKARIVALDDAAWGILGVWLERGKALGMNGRHPVFCNLKGGRLLPSYCRRLFTRLGEKAGIGKRVHPHGLRHTGAAEMRAEGIDIGVISKQLGHASISTTSLYLNHLSPQAVIDAMRARQWKV